MARRYHQGMYKCRNAKKYRGDASKIVYRSGLELKYFRYCDTNPNVLWWNSEETIVPYVSCIDGKPHRYFVDLTVCVKQKDGKEKVFLVEIKPFSQTKPPKEPKRKTKYYGEALKTFAVNQSKWKAATDYASKKGMKFIILTEKDIK